MNRQTRDEIFKELLDDFYKCAIKNIEHGEAEARVKFDDSRNRLDEFVLERKCAWVNAKVEE